MKKTLLSLITLSLLFIACEKEDSLQNDSSIIGKWMLDKYVETCYSPTNTVISNDETIGTPGDSLVFTTSNLLYTYSDIDGNNIDNYELLNDSTLRIEFEEWKITRLTNTELNLLSDETDMVTNERTVVKAFLKRP